MQKNLFLSLFGVAVFILVVGLVVQANQGKTNILSPYLHPVNTESTPVPLSPNLKELTIGNIAVMVQVANNDATRSKGLGGVTQMPQAQGMFFVFDSKQITPSFWMKDMQIPLDFIWISNNKVAEITANVAAPAPNTPDSQLKVYTPTEPIDYVLEVNSGFASKNNVKVGDSVTLNF